MPRLTKLDWIDHGLDSLERSGFTSLKADVLAKSLGVSRGSFYHHFVDLSKFHTAVLERWLEVSSLAIASQLESEGLEPAQKIRALLDLAASRATRLEQAVRAWGFTDPAVAETVTEVDRARLGYIQKVLSELNLDEQTAQRRSVLLYLTNVGYSFLSEVLEPAELETALVDLVAYATEGSVT